MDERLKLLEDNLKTHLVQEALEDIRLERIDTEQKDFVKSVIEQHQHLFSQNKTIFEKIDVLADKVETKFLVINQDIKEILREMRK